MKNKENRGTVSKVLNLTHRIVPGYITFVFMVKMIAAFQPFISIYFSSLILDGLFRLDPFETIFKNVIIMLVIDAVLVLIRWGLELINWVKKLELMQKVNKMLVDKTMDLDFDILEKHETLDMYKKAKDGMTAGGDIRSFIDNLAGLIEKISTIVYSLVLLVPLFIPRAASEVGALSGLGFFLNQWYSFTIMVVVLAVHVFMSYKTNKKASQLQMEFFEKNVSYNRYFGYWFNLIFDYSIGKYIRLYKMQKLMTKRVQETNDKLEAEGNAWINKSLKISMVPIFSQGFMQLASYVFVGLKAVFGLITTGKCIMYVSSYTKLVESITGISDNFVQLKMESRYLSFFYDYMEIKNKRYDGTIPTEKRDDNVFEIEFRDVSFKYANAENWALRHVNQKITLGTKNAVVGKNGAVRQPS